MTGKSTPSYRRKPGVNDESQAHESTDDGPTIRWDDSKMQTAYANVVNAASTREEVSLLFGTNQTWKAGEEKEYFVQLSHRIVLNPYAAKRLLVLVSKLMQEYERRFGPLKLEGKHGG
jgi:Protein of unknown function (DUF3467)